MPKRLIDDFIDRLETHNMAVSGLRCVWCSSCLHVGVIDPQVKGSFNLLGAGEENCRQPISSGSISECIDDLRREAGMWHRGEVTGDD